MLDTRAYWLCLRLLLPARRVWELVRRFDGDAERAWKAPISHLGGPRVDLRELEAARCALDPAEEWRKVAAFPELSMLTALDEAYPAQLREGIPDPPPLLFVLGKVPPLERAVAIVGTRRPSEGGRKASRALGRGLAEAGCVVVSGLAAGIDGEAHCGAMEARGGLTVAVLGHGFAHQFPAEHRELRERILEKGALLSELPPSYPPSRHTFPSRNRIISGLSAATVVVEAGERSGALITAGAALEQGREVMAFPGAVWFPCCEGSNRLLREGARPVTCASEVLEELGWKGGGESTTPRRNDGPGSPQQLGLEEGRVGRLPLSEAVLEIWEALEAGPQSLDQLATQLRCSPAEAAPLLAELELRGVLDLLAGHRYQRGPHFRKP